MLTLFGCRHPHITRPFTIDNECYQACLDCGKHLPYNANEMQPIRSGATAKDARRIAKRLSAIKRGMATHL